jgi:hypothetical protein
VNSNASLQPPLSRAMHCVIMFKTLLMAVLFVSSSAMAGSTLRCTGQDSDGNDVSYSFDMVHGDLSVTRLENGSSRTTELEVLDTGRLRCPGCYNIKFEDAGMRKILSTRRGTGSILSMPVGGREELVEYDLVCRF